MKQTAEQKKIASIKRKILACRRLSDDIGASDNEREIAIRHAVALAARYNLELCEIEIDDQVAPAVVEKEHIMKGTTLWQAIIAMGLAQLYFCKAYTARAGVGKGLYVVGEQINRNIAKNLIVSIIRSVKKEGGELYAREGFCGCSKASWIRSFANGASHVINRKCIDLLLAGKTGELEDFNHKGSNLPALSDAYTRAHRAVDAFLWEAGVRSRPTGTRVANQAAYHAGRAFGKRTGVRQGLTT